MPRHTAHAEALVAAEELRGDDASSQEDTGFMVVWGWEWAGFLGGAQPNVLVPCYEERERTEPSLEGGGITFLRSNLSPVAQLPARSFPLLVNAAAVCLSSHQVQGPKVDGDHLASIGT